MDSASEHAAKLQELNRKIVQIKKKIQLTEGQRKALFEELEAERKRNAEDIAQLKKDVSELVVSVHRNKRPDELLKDRDRRLKEVIGPIGDKDFGQVKELLDLQIIDKQKQLNLLHYRVKQKRKFLNELGIQYRDYQMDKEKKHLVEKVEKPIRKSTSELQNNIHAVEVQIREAATVRNKYLDIKRKLKEDSSKFENSIKSLEEEMKAQNEEIDKLQKVLIEASKMKSLARIKLLEEEKSLMAAASEREKEAAEGKKLVLDRRQELEKLEKRIFQGGKLPVRPEPEGAETDGNEDDKSETIPHPIETYSEIFDVLKQATGGSGIEQVLSKFEEQKVTKQKLLALRHKAEVEKRQCQNKLDKITSEFENIKFNEAKDLERKSGQVEKIKSKILNYERKKAEAERKKQAKEEALNKLKFDLLALHLSVNPEAAVQDSALKALEVFKENIQCLLNKFKKPLFNSEIIEQMYATVHTPDDKWLPMPYSTLIRRTPMPPAGGSPAPPPAPGSDDEEEVPSRSYLKRQAQLVIDTKTRRKNLRLQLPQTKLPLMQSVRFNIFKVPKIGIRPASSKSALEEIIRVDHAGELGADRIYAGQMAVLGTTSKGPLIQHMWEQEKGHRAKFEELIRKHRVRPTVMTPIWNVAGFVLGAGTALLGEKAAMACTVAVETVIVEHYNDQLRQLLKDPETNKELLETIRKFRDEEQEHHDTGIDHGAEETPFYQAFSSAIKFGCKAAISISKVI